MDMTAVASRESSAAKGETVVPFAHDPITSTSDETEASHVHAAKEEEEEEAIEVHTMPRSIKDAIRDVSLPDPQDLEEEESPNKHDSFLLMESKENQQQQMTMNCWLAIITPHRMETF